MSHTAALSVRCSRHHCFPPIVFVFSSPQRYNVPVPSARTCLVSFIDSEGIRHSVEVTASTLYQAAALAIGDFRRSGFTAEADALTTVPNRTESFRILWMS